MYDSSGVCSPLLDRLCTFFLFSVRSVRSTTVTNRFLWSVGTNKQIEQQAKEKQNTTRSTTERPSTSQVGRGKSGNRTAKGHKDEAGKCVPVKDAKTQNEGEANSLSVFVFFSLLLYSRCAGVFGVGPIPSPSFRPQCPVVGMPVVPCCCRVVGQKEYQTRPDKTTPGNYGNDQRTAQQKTQGRASETYISTTHSTQHRSHTPH